MPLTTYLRLVLLWAANGLGPFNILLPAFEENAAVGIACGIWQSYENSEVFYDYQGERARDSTAG